MPHLYLGNTSLHFLWTYVLVWVWSDFYLFPLSNYQCAIYSFYSTPHTPSLAPLS